MTVALLGPSLPLRLDTTPAGSGGRFSFGFERSAVEIEKTSMRWGFPLSKRVKSSLTRFITGPSLPRTTTSTSTSRVLCEEHRSALRSCLSWRRLQESRKRAMAEVASAQHKGNRCDSETLTYLWFCTRSG